MTQQEHKKREIQNKHGEQEHMGSRSTAREGECCDQKKGIKGDQGRPQKRRAGNDVHLRRDPSMGVATPGVARRTVTSVVREPAASSRS